MLSCRRHTHVVGAQTSTVQTGLGQLRQQIKPILVDISPNETGTEINVQLLTQLESWVLLLAIGISSLPSTSNQHKRFGHYHQLPHRIESTLAKYFSQELKGKVRTNLEGEAHRAATFFGSVGLKHHVVVHLQHSALPHVNLGAGFGRLS